MSQEKRQSNILQFMNKRARVLPTTTFDITREPWLVSKVAMFLPRAARDELRCVNRNAYWTLTDVPGCSFWHKRVCDRDVYHAPLELMRLVINVLNAVQSSNRVFLNVTNDFSFDLFDVMSFSDIRDLVDIRTIDSEIIITCQKLLRKFCDKSSKPWTSILLFIIDDAKRHGLCNKDQHKLGFRGCPWCGSNNGSDVLVDTFWDFNTRRGMFVVLATSRILNHMMDRYDNPTTNLPPLPHFVISDVISRYRYNPHKQYPQRHIFEHNNHLCYSMLVEAVNSLHDVELIVNDNTGRFSYVDVSIKPVNGRNDLTDEEMEMIHDADVHEDIAADFLINRARHLDKFIIDDYDSFVSLLLK